MEGCVKMRKIYKIGGLIDKQFEDDIEDNISQIDGVGNVDVDYNHKTVIVDFDEGVVEMDLIESTLTSLGYGIRYEIQ